MSLGPRFVQSETTWVFCISTGVQGIAVTVEGFGGGTGGSLVLLAAIPPSQGESLPKDGADTQESRTEWWRGNPGQRGWHCQSPWMEPYLNP